MRMSGRQPALQSRPDEQCVASVGDNFELVPADVAAPVSRGNKRQAVGQAADGPVRREKMDAAPALVAGDQDVGAPTVRS